MVFKNTKCIQKFAKPYRPFLRRTWKWRFIGFANHAQLRTPLVNYNYLSSFSRNSLLFGYNVRQLLVRSLYELGSVSSTSTQQGFHDLGFGRERPPREGSEKAAVRISPTWSLSRDGCFFDLRFLSNMFFQQRRLIFPQPYYSSC